MTDPDSYDEQLSINNAQMEALLKQIFPDLDVPYEYLYDTLKFLEETHVNPQVLPRVIRGIHNITIGTGNGEVIVHVRDELTTITAKEQSPQVQTKNDKKVDTGL